MSTLRLLIFILVVPVFLVAQVEEGQVDNLKLASARLTGVLDDRVSAIVPGPLLQRSKATYLEDYGMIVTIEIALERPRNPFSAVRPPEELLRLNKERRELLKEGAISLLTQNVAELKALSSNDWATVVIHMLNTNPADLPGLPTQLVVSAKKRDVIALGFGRISDPIFRSRLRVREY